MVAQNARACACVRVWGCACVWLCVQTQNKQQIGRHSVIFMKQDVHSFAIFVEPFNSTDKKKRLYTIETKANQLCCATARDLFKETMR